MAEDVTEKVVAKEGAEDVIENVDDWIKNNKKIESETSSTTVYRVDEKKHPRMIIYDDGNVEIPVVKTGKWKERELFINVNQRERAEKFLRRRIKQNKPAEIKAVEVDLKFVDKLRREAVLEADLADFPSRPVKVDLPTPDQFGLKTSKQIEEFRKAIKPGSGKVLDQE